MNFPQHVFDSILLHAEIEAPKECVGLVGEREGHFTVLIARNAADRPDRFFIEPFEQYQLERNLRRMDHDLVGIYHSHNNGYKAPSQRDLDFAANHPGVAMLIAVDGEVLVYDCDGTPR